MMIEHRLLQMTLELEELKRTLTREHLTQLKELEQSLIRMEHHLAEISIRLRLVPSRPFDRAENPLPPSTGPHTVERNEPFSSESFAASRADDAEMGRHRPG